MWFFLVVIWMVVNWLKFFFKILVLNFNKCSILLVLLFIVVWCSVVYFLVFCIFSEVFFLIRNLIMFILLNLVVNIRGVFLFVKRLGDIELICLLYFSNLWRCLIWFFFAVKCRRDWDWKCFVIFLMNLLIWLCFLEFCCCRIV